MQTKIHPELVDLAEVQEADAILRSCVHCGFCTATCPTYQLLGDELDGPRGRIYLIKNLLEQNTISEASTRHLDRCLTCRACETTCPSGVDYGRLADIGRGLAAERTEGPWLRNTLARLLRFVVPRGYLFKPLLKLGQLVKPVLPGFLEDHIPRSSPAQYPVSSQSESRILLLSGCVQSAATPNVVASLGHLLTATGNGYQVVDEGCCGALDYHLAAHDAGMTRMRRLIDLLYPRLSGVDVILSSASGCGVTIKEYPQILQQDPVYAARAREVAEKVKDPVEYLEEVFAEKVFNANARRVAVQTPCSLQHGQRLPGRIEAILAAAGYEILPQAESHLCCGSAGSYSILEPELSGQLRERKLANLTQADPDVIVTANIGCQTHLAGASPVPVMHWLELLAEDLS